MYARVSTLEGSPESIEQGITAIRDQVWPAAEKLDGFKGIIALGDRARGKMIALTLWETEGDLRASEEVANRLRTTTAEASSAQIAGVERFEVVFDQRM